MGVELLPELIAALAAGRVRVLDLSHAVSVSFPSWPGEAGLSLEPGSDLQRDGYFTRVFRMPEHFATHVDAPAHFAAGAAPADMIPVERLVCPAVVIDVRKEAGQDADYCLAASGVERWERGHGRIPAGALVVLRTGWAARLPDAARYLNADPHGVLHFPGFSAESARMFLERGVSGIATDTMSTDCGASREHPVHRLCLGGGMFQIENLADREDFPEAGAVVLVAPLKLEGGSGAPCRVLAFVGSVV